MYHATLLLRHFCKLPLFSWEREIFIQKKQRKGSTKKDGNFEATSTLNIFLYKHQHKVEIENYRGIFCNRGCTILYSCVRVCALVIMIDTRANVKYTHFSLEAKSHVLDRFFLFLLSRWIACFIYVLFRSALHALS